MFVCNLDVHCFNEICNKKKQMPYWHIHHGRDTFIMLHSIFVHYRHDLVAHRWQNLKKIKSSVYVRVANLKQIWFKLYTTITDISTTVPQVFDPMAFIFLRISCYFMSRSMQKDTTWVKYVFYYVLFWT